AGERALTPFRVGHGDDGRLCNARVRHQQVLQVHAAHPFTAALHQVLGAVGDGHEPLLVDRADVTGTQPAVVGELVTWRADLVIRARHEGSTDLDLAHGATIVRWFGTVLGTQSQVDQWQRYRAHRGTAELLVFGCAGKRRGHVRLRGDGRGF